MTKYVAFLRGINVGGHKKVPMEQLRKCLEATGLKKVKTLLASGNVIFETGKSDIQSLNKKIASSLKEEFGFDIPLIIRTAEQIQKLVQRNPFKSIKVDSNTRLYVTFLNNKPRTYPKLPYVTPEGDFTILEITDGEVLSVLRLTPGMGTTDSMNILEKEFGRDVTTRNWNTVIKLLNE
ncbi:MAG: DUF1697 domain-containing protein [Chitinophagaceae bacterium]|nr:DUF1697 domain-containing protein [Chitinophagaceae bacterium]